jgi:16S rRNA A1518/A1519 N6-dimethyltransferase RsmA/KsgA/DIM1 with predicted DNA glycosylase/AP lyase activity
MNIEINPRESSGVERHIQVSVPVDAVKAAEDSAARRYASSVRLPGFRPGKAPPAMVRKKFAEAIRQEALEAIVRDADVRPDDAVLEIGTGAGSLTDRLAAAAGRVWSFEIDPAIHALAAELLAGRPNVTLVLGDGAEFERVVDVPRLKVVANLPYEPWKRLLLRLLSTSLAVESYTLMLQKDVVDRLRAAPGTRA